MLRTDGTDAINHGFDILFVTLGIRNSEETAWGKTDSHQNKGIAMGGHYILGFPYPNSDMLMTTLHETLHTFDAIHTGWFYIMTGSQPLSLYTMSSTTYNLVNADGGKDKYDGV